LDRELKECRLALAFLSSAELDKPRVTEEAMGYVLYSTVFLFLAITTGRHEPHLISTVLTILPALILTRHLWLHRLPFTLPSVNIPGSNYLYSRLPSTFAGDVESGFSSSAFDLSGNITAGDSRAGLDDAGKREIQKIMKNKKVNFDEARRIYTEGRFAKNNIGPDGRPRDPKFVSFS
jgi:hypothetical protein